MEEAFYGADLAHVHDAGFGAWARGAAPFVLERLGAAGIEDGLVVDLGCGSGIWAAELLAHGYDVLGVDGSAGMLAIARERAPGAQLVQGSIHEVGLPRCAAVTAMGEIVNYGGPPTLAPLLARVHAALMPGGLLVLDAAGPGREPTGRRSARYEGDGWAMWTESCEDREQRMLTRRIEVVRDGRSSAEVHLLRLYDPDDVLAWMASAGFEAAERHDDYGGEAPRVPGMHVYVATRTKR